MISKKEIKERAQKSIAEAGALILKSYLLSPEQKIAVANAISCEIELSDRMRTRAGLAYTTKNKIKLNARMLSIYNSEIEPTAVHEFCHLVAENIYKNIRVAHGRQWQEMMRIVGYEPERTHSMKADFLERPVYAIGTCECREHEFHGKARIKSIVVHGSTYRCKRCRKEISVNLTDDGRKLQDQLNAKHYNTSEKFFSDLRKEK